MAANRVCGWALVAMLFAATGSCGGAVPQAIATLGHSPWAAVGAGPALGAQDGAPIGAAGFEAPGPLGHPTP